MMFITENKRPCYRAFALVLSLFLTCALASAATVPYRDARLPVEERVADLLSRMTVEEKVGQLLCLMGWNSYVRQGDAVATTAEFRQQVKEQHVGMYWAVLRADPWTQKTLTSGLNPRLAVSAVNAMQRYATDSTRLGIPLLLAEEAPHGHMAIGATVFPTGLGMAATWSSRLMEQAGQVIGREVRLQGGHISYGPVIDLSRDPRWSRVEETLGEDPFLSGEMAAAMIKGMGGGNLSKPYSTAATLKHFIAYGAAEGGQNGARSLVGERELKQFFLPPFKRAMDAGARSVMTAYSAIDGIPCSADSLLLNGVLRTEWEHDDALVVSDLFALDMISGGYHLASSRLEAACMALRAGVDVDLGGNCFPHLVQAVNDGLVSTQWLNRAVARVLRLKFEMGLFENPYLDAQSAASMVNNDDAVSVARRMAQASVTLLKNNGILPLSRNARVAVVGPNADNVYNQLGDYTAPQPDEKVVTILEGIKEKLPTGNCTYARGCAVRDSAHCDIDAAVQAACAADVVVAVAGGSSARDFRTSYEQTGAAVTGTTVSDMDCGEGFDRASLSLLGRQDELLKALKQTGKPLVVVYVEGRPLEKNWAHENADALLTAYYPGEQGGTAIADVLLGDYNPAGRLPVSVPRNVGQLPVYYNRPAPAAHDYTDMPSSPLYPFGYGLSYTTFHYSDIEVTPTANGDYDVSFMLTNTGNRSGDEVVQLYVHHDRASVIQPERTLAAFDRVTLEAGESQRVTLRITRPALAIVGKKMQWTLEPGTCSIMVGASSTDIRLTASITIKPLARQ